MLQLMLIIFVASFVVAVLGRKRKFGFWGYFFASILLSPIIGLLLVAASSRKPSEQSQVTEAAGES